MTNISNDKQCLNNPARGSFAKESRRSPRPTVPTPAASLSLSSAAAAARDLARREAAAVCFVDYAQARPLAAWTAAPCITPSSTA
eukprot:scaffold109803_cov32-Tisochrysis_lutea.AAC.1